MKQWQQVLKQGLEYYEAMDSGKGFFSLTNRDEEKEALRALLSETVDVASVVVSLQGVKKQINKADSLLSLLVDMALVVFRVENQALKPEVAEAALDKISEKLKKRGDLVGFQMALIVAEVKTNFAKSINVQLREENEVLTKAKATKERLEQEKHEQATQFQKKAQLAAEQIQSLGGKLEATLRFLYKNNKKLMSSFIDELFVEDLILESVYKKIIGLDKELLGKERYNGIAIMYIQAIAMDFYKKYQNVYKQLVYGEATHPIDKKSLEKDLEIAIKHFNFGNGFESTANFAKGHADFLTEQTPKEKEAYDEIAARREVIQLFKIFFKNMQTRLAFQQQKYPEYKSNHAEFIQANRKLLAARAQEVYQRRVALDEQQVKRKEKGGFFKPGGVAEKSDNPVGKQKQPK